MKAFAALALLACPLALLAQPRDPHDARPDHERHVGVQVEQRCEARTLIAVAHVLHVDRLRQRGPDEQFGESDATVEAAACRRQPTDPRLLIVAVAWDDGVAFEKAFAVLLLDEAHGRAVSSWRGRLFEDAATSVVQGSLWIDVADDELRPGARAIGVDVSYASHVRCGEGGSGAMRSLYVQDGDALRPVLEGQLMSAWEIVQSGGCGANDEFIDGVVLRRTVTMAVAPTSTHGWRDLRLTSRRVRDDGQPVPNPIRHAVLKYDGTRYVPVGLDDDAF